MALKSFGLNAVDWEQRVDFDRLRRDRVARLRSQLERSDLGALLAFDFYNIRYMTATHIGTWAMDKLIRFSLLPRGGEPVIWDFGSAAKHHVLYNPWLDYGQRLRARLAPRDLDPAGRFQPEGGKGRGGGPFYQTRAGQVRPRRRARGVGRGRDAHPRSLGPRGYQRH